VSNGVGQCGKSSHRRSLVRGWMLLYGFVLWLETAMQHSSPASVLQLDFKALFFLTRTKWPRLRHWLIRASLILIKDDPLSAALLWIFVLVRAQIV